MSRHRALVHHTVLAGEASRMIAAGEIVDLSDIIRVSPPLTLGDCVKADWYEAISPIAAPVEPDAEEPKA
jgi:hypothetical protein